MLDFNAFFVSAIFHPSFGLVHFVPLYIGAFNILQSSAAFKRVMILHHKGKSWFSLCKIYTRRTMLYPYRTDSVPMQNAEILKIVYFCQISLTIPVAPP